MRKYFLLFLFSLSLLYSNNYEKSFYLIKDKLKKEPSSLAKAALNDKNPNSTEKKLVNDKSRLKFIISKYKGKKQYNFIITNSNLYKLNKKNKELLKEGKAPIGKDGKRIELHHLRQKNNGLLIETSHTFHKKYDKELHPNKKVQSEINRNAFRKVRKKNYIIKLIIL